jgi:YVTN family beta-propeller protein
MGPADQGPHRIPARCRSGVAVTPGGETAFVTNFASNTVPTIDVKTRTKNPTDITVGPNPIRVAVTPCRR